jgi:hypothetical protein
MPRPLYIICSEDGSQDAITNLMSFFNVLEKILFVRHRDGDTQPALLFKFHAVSVWTREETDSPEDEFESELSMYTPPNGNRVSLGGSHRFKFEAGRRFMRIASRYQGPAPFESSGILRFESRIRKVGTEEWTTQEYSLEVEEAPQPTDSAPVSAA